MENRSALFPVGLVALLAILIPSLGRSKVAQPPAAQAAPSEQTPHANRDLVAGSDELPDALLPLWDHLGGSQPASGKGPLDLNQKPRPTWNQLHSQAQRRRVALRSLILCVPDPQASALRHRFDRALQGLVMSFTEGETPGFIPGRFHFPWKLARADGKEESTGAFDADRLWAKSPGSLLFHRRVEASEGHSAPSTELWVSFLVGETQKLGVDQEALRKALEFTARLLNDPARPNSPEGVRFERALDPRAEEVQSRCLIVGPTFSGSALSFRNTLEAVNGAKVPTPTGRTLVIAPSMSNSRSRDLLMDRFGWEFLPLAPMDSPREVIYDAWIWSKVLGAPREGRLNKAEFRESGSPVGQGGHTPGRAWERHPLRGLEGWGIPEDLDQPCSRPDAIPFPIHISALREARRRETNGANNAIQGALEDLGPLALPKVEGGRAPDLLPRMSPLSKGTDDHQFIERIQGLAQRKDRLVSLDATDPLDAAYLAHRVKLHHPGALLLLHTQDLLFAHPDMASDMDGAFAVSSYPLHLPKTLSSGSLDAPFALIHASAAETSIYNACTLARQALPKAPEPRLHGMTLDSRDGRPKLRRWLWFSVVKGGTFWPLDKLELPALPLPWLPLENRQGSRPASAEVHGKHLPTAGTELLVLTLGFLGALVGLLGQDLKILLAPWRWARWCRLNLTPQAPLAVTGMEYGGVLIGLGLMLGFWAFLLVAYGVGRLGPGFTLPGQGLGYGGPVLLFAGWTSLGVIRDRGKGQPGEWMHTLFGWAALGCLAVMLHGDRSHPGFSTSSSLWFLSFVLWLHALQLALGFIHRAERLPALATRRWMRGGSIQDQVNPLPKPAARGLLWGLLLGMPLLLAGLHHRWIHPASPSSEWWSWWQMRNLPIGLGPSLIAPLTLLVASILLFVILHRMSLRNSLRHPAYLSLDVRPDAGDSPQPSSRATWLTPFLNLLHYQHPRELLGRLMLLGAPWLAILTFVFPDALHPFGESLRWQYILKALFFLASLLTLSYLVRLLLLWKGLKSTLRRMELESYAPQFGILGKEIQWTPQLSLKSLLPESALREPTEARKLLQLIPAEYWNEHLSELEGTLNDSLNSALHESEEENPRSFLIALHQVESALARAEDHLRPVSEASEAIQKFRGFRAYLFIRRSIYHLKYSLILSLAPVPLLFAATTTHVYATEGLSALLLGFAVVQLSAVVVILVQLEQNRVLSLLGRTTPGKVGWNSGFVVTLAKFVVAPAAILILFKFPAVAYHARELLGMLGNLFG